jgi:ankyrin repeat protein
MLLAAGAVVDAKDSHGATALAYAACEGHADLVELYLAHGASVRGAGMACERSHFDIENVVHVCDDQAPPLECARVNDHPDVVRLLEEALKKK